jgi:hypothetical protein
MNGAKLPDGRSVLPMNDQVTSLLHDMQYGDGAVNRCPARRATFSAMYFESVDGWGSRDSAEQAAAGA